MRTKAPAAPERAGNEADSPLSPLLDRVHRPAADAPAHVDGIVLGRLAGFDAHGNALVTIPQFGFEAIPARTLQTFTPAQIGCELALGFEGGQPDRPIVLGAMFGTAVADAVASAETDRPVVREEDGRVVVEAEGELELRCGRAVIRLDASGRIDIRGGYINTHASATQRIRGGSVQIN